MCPSGKNRILCVGPISTPNKKVVVGLQDPNPLVSGKGIEILQRAGIEVELYSGPLESSLSQVPEVFCTI